MSPAPVRTVSVAVLTFRRPERLGQGIPVILAQAEEVTARAGSGYEVSILIIDNDPEASARSAVRQFGSARIRYAVEPRPGISAARNRALSEAQDSDLLAFIDDDEVPQPGWLQALLDARQRSGAAAVAGAVISRFEQDLEPWIVAGGFFVRRRFASGASIAAAATNNLLLDLHVVRALGLRFDEDFGLSGGEDTLFTRRLSASGALLVWCDEAVVTDQVPAARSTRRWVLKRAFSSGNSQSRVAIRLAGSSRDRLMARALSMGRGTPRVLLGLARYVAGLVLRSAVHQARGLRTAARGTGIVSGAFGYTYQEYQRAEVLAATEAGRHR